MTDDDGKSGEAGEASGSGGTGGSDDSGRSGGTGDGRADAASPEKVERLAAEYRERGQPHARVTVVRREPPVSANVGDRALVTPDGELVGWIGGAGCAQSVVTRAALDALESGDPVLVGLAPDPEDVDRPGVEAHPMTCHSGGTLELFVEPVAPAPRLVVVGDSPIARALVRLAGELTYEVTVVTDGETAEMPGAARTVTATDADAVADAIEGAAYVVVASMGEFDDLGVVAGLRAGASYVGLVASENRRAELAETAADRLDSDPETVVERTTRAGLDIGAETAEEIAVSILAELTECRRAGEAADIDIEATGAEADEDADADTDGTATDPVCGMDVAVGEAAATVDYGGETYHFCGQGCADAFKDDPGRYLDTEVTASD